MLWFEEVIIGVVSRLTSAWALQPTRAESGTNACVGVNVLWKLSLNETNNVVFLLARVEAPTALMALEALVG